MGIDTKRMKLFQADIEALQNELSFDEYNRLVQAKIIDYVGRNADYKQLDQGEWMKLLRPFYHEEYIKYVYETMQKYDQALEAVNHYYDDLGPELQRDWEKITATEEALLARYGKYEKSAIKFYARTMRQAVMNGLDHKEIAVILKSRGGKIETYADTLARTGVKGVSRTAKVEKARLGEVFYQQYVGIIRSNTRPFCEAMKGQTRHINIIRQMRNGQIEPVSNFCGGFRCHHDWEPDPGYKPPEDWRKKIKWQTVRVGKRTMKYTLKK